MGKTIPFLIIFIRKKKKVNSFNPHFGIDFVL